MHSRTKSDVLAAAGMGFPITLGLSIIGAYAANTTGAAGLLVPPTMGVPTSSNSRGAGLVISGVSFWAGTPSDRTTGVYTFNLVACDSTGAVNFGTLATFTVPAAAGPVYVDLRDSSGNGVVLPHGQSLRLDTGAAPTGGTTNASQIKIEVWAMTFGMAV